jgi:hypothetical protein
LRLITAFGCKTTPFERIDAFGDAMTSALRDLSASSDCIAKGVRANCVISAEPGEARVLKDARGNWRCSRNRVLRVDDLRRAVEAVARNTEGGPTSYKVGILAQCPVLLVK